MVPTRRRRPAQVARNEIALRLAVTFARNLMLAFSRRRVTGTAEGVYRVIATLLFEVLTGEGDVDLKRACDRVLRDVRLGLSAT